MYIKWIVCQVKEGMKDAFSHAQEQWISTAEAEGFIAQAGGWNTQNESEACIIAFWESREYAERFMATLHDRIVEENRQSETYHTINVAYFDGLLEMKGQTTSLAEAVGTSELLRVADCVVHSGRTGHFESVQQSVWLPAMQQAKGMLGGMFSKAVDTSNRYLVSTFWDTGAHHDQYRKEQVPILRENASVTDDLQKLIGKQIHLVKSWNVLS
jgi:heme-degrading monooxygenase HmoA